MAADVAREVGRKTSPNLKGLAASLVLLIGSPPVGLGVSSLLLGRAFGDVASPTIDPSRKARMLAESISGAMNGAAVGMTISLLALVPTIFFAVRLSRERAAERAADREPAGDVSS